MRCHRFALIVLALLVSEVPAYADQTMLLEVDMRTGRKRRFDAGGRGAGGSDLDAMLDAATGKSFSSEDLEKIEKALRHNLTLVRPRAKPRALMFLYPGRVSKSRLKELRSVHVETEMSVDECGRTVCRDSVVKHLEALARSIKKPRLLTPDYSIHFQSVTIRASGGEQGVVVYKFTARQVLDAAAKGSVRRLVGNADKASAGFVSEVTRTLLKLMRRRRLRSARAPEVRRDKRDVSIAMTLKTDRVRYKAEVLRAFAAAVNAVRKHPVQPPPRVSLKVTALVRVRKVERRVYTVSGRHAELFADARVNSDAMWSNYITFENRKGKRLVFSE